MPRQPYVDRRARQTGKGGGNGRFVMLPLIVLESEACAKLQHGHFRVLMALAAAYDGRNNGALTLTRPRARRYGIASNETLALGLRALETRKLISVTDPGQCYPPAPARYAIAWRPMDQTDFSTKAAAPHGYRHWQNKASSGLVRNARLACLNGNA